MTQPQLRLKQRLIRVGLHCLLLNLWALCSPGETVDLFVGNFFGSGNILQFNGNTGAFESNFVPDDSFPLGAAFGPDGNFYASNSNTDSIGRYNGTTGASLGTFASDVEDAAGLAFGTDNNLYIADSTAPGFVTKLNGTTGAPITTLTAGNLVDPEGVVFGPDHKLYVANNDGDDVVQFNATTATTFAAAGSGANDLKGPRGVAFGPDGNLYVASFGTDEVLKYDGATGAFLGVFVTADSGGLSLPRDLAFGPDGNLYVSSFGSGDILRYNGTTGAFIDKFIASGTDGLGGPTFLLFHEAASTTIPEPSLLGLLGLGAVGFVVWKRKKV